MLFFLAKELGCQSFTKRDLLQQHLHFLWADWKVVDDRGPFKTDEFGASDGEFSQLQQCNCSMWAGEVGADTW